MTAPWYDKHTKVIHIFPLAHPYDELPDIPPSVANIRCDELGVDGLLRKLNLTFGTSHQLPGRASLFFTNISNLLGFPRTFNTQSLRLLLEHCISEKYDFGKALGYVGRIWSKNGLGVHAITSALANTRCDDLGIDGLLRELNVAFGTSYQLPGRTSLFFMKIFNLLGFPCAFNTQSLRLLLEHCISENYDFGAAFSYLRPAWFDLTTITDRLHVRKEQDNEMRESVVVNGQIIDRRLPPRRVWDLYSNRVVPHWMAGGKMWAISHAWVEAKDRDELWTPINGFQWPVPLPRDADLEQIRLEVLDMGAEYVWLDVLCLRQPWGLSRGELFSRLEEEHELDVPTIGHVYETSERVVCFFSGLGLPLTEQRVLGGDRSWFERAWTLQEAVRNWTMGGVDGGDPQVQQEAKKLYDRQLSKLRKSKTTSATVFGVLSLMRERKAESEVDKVSALAYLLRSMTLPMYNRGQSPQNAWKMLANTMDRGYRGGLFFLFPTPGEGDTKWRPSWDQVMVKALPSADEALVYEVDREDDIDWYRGPYIEAASVQGLADTNAEGPRQGELIIEGHTFRVIATHEYSILEGTYALAGSSDRKFWVLGQQNGDLFGKLSVLRMLDAEKLELQMLATERRIRLI